MIGSSLSLYIEHITEVGGESYSNFIFLTINLNFVIPFFLTIY